MVIDCHGHYTTAPKELQAFRDAQIAALKDPRAPRRRRSLDITDDQIRESVAAAAEVPARSRHRRHDLLAARVGDGASHRRRRRPACDWTRALQRSDSPRLRRCSRRTSSACASCRRRRGDPLANCIAELERCVNELGFIGCNLNPDPSGGHWTAPPLTDRYWYPFYEKMVELDVPAMVHVSASCNPNFHATGAHYINADTTAFMQFLTGRPVQGLPGAAVDHPARRRRGAVSLGPLSRPGAGHEAAAARRT